MPVSHGQDEAIPRTRRKRRPISCLPCRHRKLKCNRTLPACANCVNRGEITQCTYVPRKAERRPEPQDSSLDLSKTAQDKIDNLERIVRMLLANQEKTQGQNRSLLNSIEDENDQDSNPPNISQGGQGSLGDVNSTSSKTTLGVFNPNALVKIDAIHDQSRSLDEGRWALLLNEIGDVRSYLNAQQKRYEQQNKIISRVKRQTSDEPGPTLLFGSSRNVSRSEILAQLPSRYSCDMIVTRFFAHLYPAIYIIHRPTFHKQYEAFWADPSKTSTVWVALLFAVLRIAMLDYIREEDEPVEFKDKCQDLANNYRNSFTDCLILADYTQPHELLIEALCFHLYAEYVSTRDAKSNIWVLCGMIIRMAMRMGFHQPSQPSLGSSPFQAEMRKRVWTFIRQADVMFSFQMGFPSMIGPHLLQGSLPRNIHDDDSFFDGCSTLPAALSDREYTQISFLIAKTKLVFGFSRALEEINRPDGLKWDRLLEIDRELRQIYDEVPGHYKLSTFSGQDSFILVSARFILASIHHKSLCIVHSNFLEIAKSDSRYIYSRQVCLSSALSILRFQVIQNQEIPVDGRMRSLTNYQTSFALHDYLLAATIIGADLYSDVWSEKSFNHQTSTGVPTRTEMIKALDTSARIFSQMRNHSMEAYKAADVLGMLVKKMQAFKHPNGSSRKNQTTATPRRPSNLGDGSGSPSSSASPYRQSLQPAFSSMSDQSSCSSVDARASIEALDLGYSQGLSRGTLEASQPYDSQSTMQRTGAFQVPHSGGFSAFQIPQDNTFCDQLSSYSEKFPDSEPSASSTSPEDMHHFANFVMGDENMLSRDTTQLSYPTPLSLSDPMSALWNLNSWTQGRFT